MEMNAIGLQPARKLQENWDTTADNQVAFLSANRDVNRRSRKTKSVSRRHQGPPHPA